MSHTDTRMAGETCRTPYTLSFLVISKGQARLTAIECGMVRRMV